MFALRVKSLSIVRNSLKINQCKSSPCLIQKCQNASSKVVESKEDGPSSVTESSKPKTNVPFMKELFLGRFDKSMLVLPEVLEQDELERLDAMVQPVERYFSEDVDSQQIDKDAKIPEEILRTLKELGLFGQQIPQQYGGLGLNATKYARMSEATSLDANVSMTLAAHQDLGLKGILIEGTEEQKEKYLPQLATGDLVAAFALTEPSSGSDAASIEASAKLSKDGTSYILNGSKIWVSNGGIADIFMVFAKAPCIARSGEEEERVTAFIVERGFGGVTSGQAEDKLGVRGLNTCEVQFNNTPVPLDNVLGEIGGGFKVAMTILNEGHFGVGASSIARLKGLAADAAEHVIERTQFQNQLKDFELIKKKFANLAIGMYVMESMVYRTAAIMDMYEEPDVSVEAAIVKVYCSEMSCDLTNQGLETFGGRSYMKNYPYERLLRDSRLSLIFTGTNEILRLYIALTCFQHAGGELMEVITRMKNPLNNVSLIFQKFAESRQVNKESPRLTQKLFTDVHPVLVLNAEQLEIRVLRFKHMVERYLGMYRDMILQEQLAVERFADMAIDLYGMTCVLARCSRSIAIGLRDNDHEILICQAYFNQCYGRIDKHLADLDLLKYNNGDEHLIKIADAMFKKGGYVPEHPLTRNW